MGRNRLEIDLRDILECYEEPFVPEALKTLTKTNPKDCTFTLLPFSDADYLARLQKVDALRPQVEEETEYLTSNTSSSRTVAENPVAAKPKVSVQKVWGQVALIVAGGNQLMCWVVRKFVRPPERYRAIWNWKPEEDEKEGGVEDPLMGLPFVGELMQAVNRKYDSSTKLLKDAKTDEPAMESAAGK